MELPKTIDKRSKILKFDAIEKELNNLLVVMKYVAGSDPSAKTVREDIFNNILAIMKIDYDKEFQAKDEYERMQDRYDWR